MIIDNIFHTFVPNIDVGAYQNSSKDIVSVIFFSKAPTYPEKHLFLGVLQMKEKAF